MTDEIEGSKQMFYPIKSVSFKGFSLIVPSVSVGNVGQLSADLLIQSLECVKAGYMWHPAILPVVGVDPFKIMSPDLALSAEVFFSEKHKIAILQLRSSIVKRLRKLFLNDMVQWIKSCGIAQVTILTGSSNEERIDEQIVSEPFRYLVSSEASSVADTFRSLGWISLERRLHFPALSKVESLGSSDTVGRIVIPGGGFAKQLLELCSENQIQCIALIKFCSEGDNVPDALVMTTKLNEWLQLIEKDSTGMPKLTFPPSWRHLFGSPPPRQLY